MVAWRWDASLTDFVPGVNFKDRTGYRYTSLVCLYPSRKEGRHTFWMCQCDCGRVREVSSCALQTSSTTSCGCRRVGHTNPRWSGYEEINGTYVKNAKKNAEIRGISFDVTIEFMWALFLLQEKRCALTGLPLHFKGKIHSDTTASLDRIDSSKGYTEDNVQWVHKKINQIKMDLPQDEFILLCKQVVDYQKEV